MSRSKSLGHVGKRVGKHTTSWYFRVDGPPDADGERTQVYRGGFQTRKEATEALHDVVGRVKDGDYIEPSKITLGEFLSDTWLEAVKPPLGVRPATWASYKMVVDTRINPHIGQIRLQRLAAADLTGLYGKLLREGRRSGKQAGTGLSSRSVRYTHAILHAAFKYAVDNDQIARNPADRATKPKPTAPTRPKVWELDELRAFLSHVADDRLSAMWLFFATTGCRRGEVLGATWECVDLDAGAVAIERARVIAGKRRRGGGAEEQIWSAPNHARSRDGCRAPGASEAAGRGAANDGRRVAGP